MKKYAELIKKIVVFLMVGVIFITQSPIYALADTLQYEQQIQLDEDDNIELNTESFIDGVIDFFSNDLVTESVSGQCGDTLYWSLENNVLTICGTGDMWDYGTIWLSDERRYVTDAPWQSYINTETVLHFEEGITSIGANAFYGCSKLSGDLIIPCGVSTIGNNAFEHCTGFKGNLIISESVVSIGESAFYGCNGFTGDLLIPKSVSKIEVWAFADCSGFNGTLTIENGVTEIGTLAFADCSGFTGDLVIPQSVSIIGVDAFFGCEGFNGKLSISEGVKSIGAKAFYGCNGFTELILPSSVENIDAYAFGYCEGFKGDLIIPENVNSIGYYSFVGCSGFDGKLVIPEGDFEIGEGAFDGCSNLTGDLIIPNGIIKIGKYAFRDCKNLNGNLVIPETVTEIGSQAFYECNGLTGNLILPTQLTSIGDYAFYNCSNLTGDLIIPSQVTEIGAYAFFDCVSFNGCLNMPEGITEIKEGTFSGCSSLIGDLDIPKSVTAIGAVAFADCRNLSGNLYIPDGVSKIQGSTFYNCSGFDGELKLPEELTEIGFRAFYGCSGLTGSLDIPESSIRLGESAFYGCKGLSGNLNIPKGITGIEKAVFYGCENLTGNLIIPDNITYIEKEAFRGCSGLTGDLIIPETVVEIGEYAFADCSGFNGMLSIPEGIAEIKKGVFSGCKNLRGSLIIPENITSIGSEAFADCSSFSGKWSIPEKVTIINDGTFRGCSGFTGDLIIPNRVTYIGIGAFQGCNGFDGMLVIPENIEIIKSDAFLRCSGFTGKLEIPKNVKKIENHAFSGCSGFTGELVIPEQVNTIGQSAFSGCSGFSGELVIPKKVIEIEYDAFKGCTNLEKIVFHENIVSIEEFAFEYCDNIQEIYFEGHVISDMSFLTFLPDNIDIYYPINKTGWSEVIKEYSYNNWIPYGKNGNETLPNFWVFTSIDDELVYNYDIGYKINSTTLNIDTGYIVPDSSSSYNNVQMVISLPEGFSFSETESLLSMTSILGTIDCNNGIRELSFPIYISAEDFMDELTITISMMADGYETPKVQTISIPIELESNKAEETIVDAVERYTSDQEIADLEDIVYNSLSDEERMEKLYEYYNFNNIFDLKDQLVELTDASDERLTYLGITSNDMYHAWRWHHYLTETPKGVLARASLYASGLAFNGELGDWLDPNTYIDGDYPGVEKYKTMLEEFINEQNASIEHYTYIKEVEKFVNGSVGLWTKLEKGEILKKIGKTTSIVEAKSLFNDFVAIEIPKTDKESFVLLGGDKTKLVSAMGYVGDIFKVSNATVDSIATMMNMSANLELYATYENFLLDIYNETELPWEMRIAAYKLQKELEEGYYAQVENILNSLREVCLDHVFDAAGLDKLFGLNGWVSTINFTTFIMNQFVDIGQLVVRSAHTEGYAILAEYYVEKLERCKTQFLANKTEENAWEFYETYILLWRLRVQGEKKYLEMNQLDANKVITNVSDELEIKTLNDVITQACHYADKEASVNRMLNTLEKFKFSYSVDDNELPENRKYLQKIMVECPVDVEISSLDGNIVCFFEDGIEQDIMNENGRFVSIYRPTTGDYVKIAYLLKDDAYSIKLVGRDIGKVSYSYVQTSNHKDYTLKGFDEISVAENNVFQFDTTDNQYSIDMDNDGIVDIVADQVDKSKISVQFDCQNDKEIIVCYVDENGYVKMPDMPQKEGYEFDGWYYELNGQGEQFSDNTLVEDSITLYANWVIKEVTEKPEVPNEPELPNKPEPPTEPEIPNVPEVPEIPNEPEMPTEPETPTEPEAPNQSDIPLEPNRPEVPNELEKPSDSDASEDVNLPDDKTDEHVREWNIEKITEDVMVINISDALVLTDEEMKDLCEKNKVHRLLLKVNNNISITFEKGTMNIIEGMNQYDFTITIVPDYTKAEIPSTIQPINFIAKVVFNYSGQLPAEAFIRIPVGVQHAGKTLYYTLLKDDGTFGTAQDIVADTEGYITVKQNHCSSYVITAENPNSVVSSPDTGNNFSSIWMLMLIVGIGMSISLVGKKFNNK